MSRCRRRRAQLQPELPNFVPDGVDKVFDAAVGPGLWVQLWLMSDRCFS
jgi:hypothetical protein